MYRAQLKWQPAAILLLLALVWGANMAIVKIGTREIAPLLMAGLRSLVASFCLFIWMKIKGIPLFPARTMLIHGIIVGIMFGLEFGLIYVGLQYTTASRTYIILYTSPFFVAIGAHIFLRDDKLNSWKAAGLLVAFCGVAILFIGDIGAITLSALTGDIMAIFAGALWGATTIYVKRFLAQHVVPLQTLFYQVFFSAPLLILMSIILEDHLVSGFSLMTAFSLFYQCIIVAFLSFIVWFELIHRYPVSLLHGFSFFTPVFGVFLSGVLILGELLSLKLMVAMLLVSMGTLLVNFQPQAKKLLKTS
ncbi:MAG: DMT family transporter [Deltaproteobacteria bacterium]|nr:DMT family transporter [Deltaproteobacteria bacterium]